MKLKTKHFHILMIVLLSFILYFNTLFNPFVYDDHFFIIDNPDIKSLSRIPSFFGEPSAGNLYRPMRSVLFTISYALFGDNPLGYHIQAILIHIFISILGYNIVLLLTKRRNLAFISAILFSAHPVHTARVANMTASFDLLGILFMFLSLWLYIKYREDNHIKKLVLSLLFFSLGLFSSEEALMTPLYILLYGFGKGGYNAKKKKENIIFFIITIAFLVLRYSILGQVGRTTEYFIGDFTTRILSTAVVFLRYFSILLFPFGLTVDYYVKLYDSLFFLPLIGFLVVLAIAFIALMNRKRNFIVYFFLGWFLISLIPFSNIFPVTTFMADRYLFTASFGFAVIISYALLSLKKKYKWVAFVLIISIFAGYCYGAISRNSEWSSDVGLQEIAVKRQPLSSMAYNNLGFEYERINKTQEAIIAYKTSIRLNPLNHIAWLNLGTFYGSYKDYQNGISFINKSINIFPTYKAYNNLGLLYREIKDYDAAVFYLKKAVEHDPKMTKARMDLGITLAEIGEFDMALSEFNKALEINYNIADIHYNLAILYGFFNQTDKAEMEFAIARQLEQE